MFGRVLNTSVLMLKSPARIFEICAVNVWKKFNERNMSLFIGLSIYLFMWGFFNHFSNNIIYLYLKLT